MLITFSRPDGTRPISVQLDAAMSLKIVHDHLSGYEDVDSHSKRDTVRIGWDRDLDALLWTFNTTPRKCLAFQTPLEAFARQLGVALET
jgi:hypothetical protein